MNHCRKQTSGTLLSAYTSDWECLLRFPTQSHFRAVAKFGPAVYGPCMVVLHHISFLKFGHFCTSCLYTSIHCTTLQNKTVCHCRCLLITSSIEVTNQCDNKLVYKCDDCEQLADAIIRVKERNTNILNSVTDLLDWLNDDQFLNMTPPLWYYITIVIYPLVT